jgi:hypothetical protein
MKLGQHCTWFTALDGPPDLFRRVRYIMESKERFQIDRSSLASVIHKREIHLKDTDDLNNILKLDKWDLLGATVRSDQGKFVSSTWERNIGSQRLRIVIGMNDYLLTIESAAPNQPLPPSDKCTPEFWKFVADVNRNLMKKDLCSSNNAVGPPRPRLKKPSRQGKVGGIPGRDFPAPASKIKELKKPVRPKPIMSAIEHVPIAVLRALTEAHRTHSTGFGRCKGCGKIAVHGSDTCYSCG